VARPNVPVSAVLEAPRLVPMMAPMASTRAATIEKPITVEAFEGSPSITRLNE
jgi:hypothetical protein